MTKQEYMHEWWLKNCEKAKATQKLWRTRYPHRMKKAKKTWLRLNPYGKILEGCRRRCTNPKQISYKYYGARGIKCHLTLSGIRYLWGRDLAYLLKAPSIDRIDPKGNYELGNCRFIELSDNAKRARQ